MSTNVHFLTRGKIGAYRVYKYIYIKELAYYYSTSILSTFPPNGHDFPLFLCQLLKCSICMNYKQNVSLCLFPIDTKWHLSHVLHTRRSSPPTLVPGRPRSAFATGGEVFRGVPPPGMAQRRRHKPLTCVRNRKMKPARGKGGREWVVSLAASTKNHKPLSHLGLWFFLLTHVCHPSIFHYLPCTKGGPAQCQLSSYEQ